MKTCLVGCLVVIALLAVRPAPARANVPVGTPEVNGLFYGDGDYANYYLLAENPDGRGSIFYNLTSNILYVAVVVGPGVNDNVFGDGSDPNDVAYVESSGWSNNVHTFKELINSDHLEFRLEIGGESRTWKQDLLYDVDNDKDPGEADWVSDPFNHDGGGSPPAGLLATASSMQWNMNTHANPTSAWDITLGGQRTSWTTYKSPDDGSGSVTNNGYPFYDTAHDWEWPLVYEMSIDVGAYGSQPFTFEVISAHNSPSKDGDPNVPIPPTVLLDLGDAPATYGTTLALNGARHQIVLDGPRLGDSVDSDENGEPTPGADGDDLVDGSDDEDGVVFLTSIRPGQQASVQVTGTAGSKLDAWIDFDGSGTWEADEKIADSLVLSGGADIVSFLVPSDNTQQANVYGRFRVSTAGGLLPTGLAQDGEVEDHMLVTAGAVGDLIWLDLNANGLQDDGEPGVEGVIVRLYDANGLYATMLTGADGRYLFDGLVAGQYQVEFGPVPGYFFTGHDAGTNAFDTIDSDADYTTGRTDVFTLGTGEVNLTLDAGLRETPTAAALARFEANAIGDEVTVEWETAYENETVGYFLERLDEAAQAYVRINDVMLPADPFVTVGAVYQVVDAGALPEGTYTYRLVELAIGGGALVLGPYTVSVGGDPLSLDAWRGHYFTDEEAGDPGIGAPDADPDGDGHSNEQEFLAGTDPTDVASVLRILSLARAGSGALELRWAGVAGRRYVVERTSDLRHGFGAVTGDIAGTPPENVLTLTLGEAPAGFYRVRLAQ